MIIIWSSTGLKMRQIHLTASTGTKRVSSSQLLLINALINWSSVSVSTSIKANDLSVCCSGAFRCVLTQCQGGKTSAVIWEKQLLLPINLGRVIRPFPNYLESIILQREKLFSSGKHLTQSSQEWTSQQVHPKVKNPRATSQTLRASVSMLNVKVHDSTIRKRLNKYGLFGRAGWESLFSLKRTWQHRLGL